MDISIRKISGRIRGLIINPKAFWKEQKMIGDSQRELLLGFYFPLLLALSVAAFIGEYLGNSHSYIGFAAAKFVRTVVLYTLQYFLSVFFTLELIKSFGGKKNLAVVQKLVVYSLAPFMLTSIISGVFPFLYVINVLGLYGFYIFWIGVQENLEFPERKESSYILIAVLVNFFLFSFLSIILSKLLIAYI